MRPSPANAMYYDVKGEGVQNSAICPGAVPAPDV